METGIMLIVVPVLTAIITAAATYLGTRYKANSELQKQREQHDAEILKIQEQAQREIEKQKAITDSQADLYEKRAQTDMVKGFMEKALSGDTSGLDHLEKLNNQIKSGKYKNVNHPAKKRK